MSFAFGHTQTGIDSTSVATTTQAIPLSLGGLTPKAVWMWAISRTPAAGSGAGAADICFTYGFATSPTARAGFAFQSDQGVTPTATDSAFRNDAILASLSTAGAVVGLLDISSLGPDEVVVIYDAQFAADMQLFVAAVAGDEITGANVVTFTKSVAGAPVDQDVATFGIDPKFVEFISIGGAGAFPQLAALGRFQIARATTSPVANQVISFLSRDNVATADSSGYATDAEGPVVQNSLTTSILARGSVTAGISGGVRINWAENNGQAIQFAALGLAGTFNVELASLLTQTDTITDASTLHDFGGIRPAGVLTLSHCQPESTSDTPQAVGECSVGACAIFTDTTSLQGVAAFIEPETNPSSGAVGSQQDPSDGTQADYLNLSTAGGVEGKMRLLDGALLDPEYLLNHRMNDADPAQNLVLLTVFAASEAEGGAGVVRDMIDRRSAIPWAR